MNTPRYFMQAVWYWDDGDSETPAGPFETRQEAEEDYAELIAAEERDALQEPA